MKIGELAAKTGVAPRLLRYYEEVGILTPWRPPNGYRSYGEPAHSRPAVSSRRASSRLTARRRLPAM
ncbi:MerR family DNA-binding transcriptional regulator [Streptomyces chartreusis]|uniref:MerR family DNA-binding transcriptional regulator n=1 Tax=Streptomyces chartreusis TaxID=1969 RepID=UPI003D90A96E